MTETDISSFHDACHTVIAECPDGYAKAYATAGLDLTGAHHIRTQCLYILNNMGRWRGDTAQQCREAFKQLSK